MSYIKDNLMPDEKVVFSARVHPAVYLPSVLVFIASIGSLIYGINLPINSVLVNLLWILLFVLLFLYSMSLGIKALITFSTTEFAVTDKRVIAKRGWIQRHTLEILLPKIESVAVNQNLMGRLINFGTVTITGTGETLESFRAIGDPIEVRKKINLIIESYRQV